jgi:hypothetical protein
MNTSFESEYDALKSHDSNATHIAMVEYVTPNHGAVYCMVPEKQPRRSSELHGECPGSYKRPMDDPGRQLLWNNGDLEVILMQRSSPETSPAGVTPRRPHQRIYNPD